MSSGRSQTPGQRLIIWPTSCVGLLHRAYEAVPVGKQPLLFNKAIGTFHREETEVEKSWSSLFTVIISRPPITLGGWTNRFSFNLQIHEVRIAAVYFTGETTETAEVSLLP